MRRGVLLSAALVVVLWVSAAEPAARPSRFVLAVVSAGSSTLYQSSDGIRFASSGVVPAAAQSASPVRRGSTLYLYDSATLGATGPAGGLRRFRAKLTEAPAATYSIQLGSPEDAARATPGGLAPSVAVDDAGALVLLYALRYEPSTNACPVAGEACIKLRTATEIAGSDGLAFAGDPGNRIVLSFAATATLDPPALLRADKGWAVLLRGPGGCLHVIVATDPHGRYGDAGCISENAPAGPSGLWDPRLREYRLYGVSNGHVVRAVSARLRRLSPARFRPLTSVPGRPSLARVGGS